VQVLSGAEPQRLSQTLRAPFSPAGRGFRSGGRARFRLGTPKAAWEAIQRLAGDGGVLPGLNLSHPHSPFGVVELQAESCTGCGQCARVCPTGALALRRKEVEITLTYAAPSCIGCGFCVEVCPEAAAQVLRVHSETNANILSRGRVVVYEDRHARCEGCGATIAPESMLRRIQKALAASDLTLSISLARYCASCRLTHTPQHRN
jgi:ferredoxin